jgi:hypothetical protein
MQRPSSSFFHKKITQAAPKQFFFFLRGSAQAEKKPRKLVNRP